MLATIARRQALKDLVPPKIATPSAVSGSEAGARMSSVIDFYSKLPKGNATQKASGIKGKYFDGQNSSRTPLLATIGGLFLIGYTLDYQLHLTRANNTLRAPQEQPPLDFIGFLSLTMNSLFTNILPSTNIIDMPEINKSINCVISYIQVLINSR
ncbi:hypothetical protein E3Q19_00027 [Wallemia mellicola]|nr:hypothetical protein E3Q19_00027 [Wallemia mellicola]TIC76085.1 hypothetical protein E3Q00_00026 [Wallemia mellicola]